MNLALGEKLMWRLVMREKEWWKTILYKNYLHAKKMKCLDHQLMEERGSSIFGLCKATYGLL
jgi:hypothetical protein